VLLSDRFIHTAAAFFVLDISLNMYTGITGNSHFAYLHTHINLLGWVALCLTGLLYCIRPHLQYGLLANLHYWLHTTGLMIFISSSVMGTITGTVRSMPITISSCMMALGVLFLAINIFTRLRPTLGWSNK
jgi:cbb3-type cytochrome oxidase subunit 1